MPTLSMRRRARPASPQLRATGVIKPSLRRGRNVYLSGAYELRHGLPQDGFTSAMMLDMLKHTEPERFLEVMASKLDGIAAADSALRINLNFTDSGVRYHLWIENAVLHHRRVAADDVAEADASLNLSQDFFLQMITGQAGVAALFSSDQVSIDGSALALGALL